MLRAYFLRPDGSPPLPVERAEIAAAYEEQGFLWVDLSGPDEDEARVLTEPFQFHPLAIEDALSPRLNAPKIDDYGAHLFVAVQAIVPAIDQGQPAMIEVGFFIGQSFLVTVHLPLVPTFDKAKALWLEGHWRTADAPDTLAHMMMDRMVDDYPPVLEALEEKVEALEESILQLSPTQMSVIIPPLKKSLGSIQRVTTPQREVFYHLSRPGWTVIREGSLAYFRDIYDHLVRLDATVDTLHQRADLALQLHLGAVANRTNEVLKVLSLVGTIFLPLTFLVGVWGMNFRFMPELEWRYGYLASWIILLAIAVAMLAYFRWRRWL